MSKSRYGDESLLTPHEIAFRLSLSKPTIDRWVREGKIPAVAHPLGKGRGRRVFFDWEQVRRALKIPGCPKECQNSLRHRLATAPVE